MDTDRILKWIQAVPFFSSFRKDELESLASEQKYFNKYNENEMIIQEGQTDQALFIILKGTVRITKDSGKNEIELTKLNEGTVFGEMTLLRKGRRTSNAIAEKATIVMTMKPDTLENLDFKLKAKFKDELLKLVLKRFETLNEKYTALLNKSTI